MMLNKFNILYESYVDEFSSNSNKFKYMLLDRLKSDCEYFLGAGNGYEGALWAGSVAKQIEEMKKLYEQLPEKPEWLSLDDINNYEKEMNNLLENKKNKF